MGILTGYVLVAGAYLLPNADLDLKSNILIDNDGHARLAGFSLLTAIPDKPTVVRVGSASKTVQRVGGIQWSAPEVLRGGEPSEEADVFSFAMVMFEASRSRSALLIPAYHCFQSTQVFSGTTPLGNVQDAAATIMITRGDRPSRPKHPYMTGGLWKVTQRCWDERPRSRPQAAEVLQTLLDSSVCCSL